MKAKQTIETHDVFHLVTDFDDGTSVSTIQINNPYRPMKVYETCIFYPGGESDVVGVYETEGKARKGHAYRVQQLTEAA